MRRLHDLIFDVYCRSQRYPLKSETCFAMVCSFVPIALIFSFSTVIPQLRQTRLKPVFDQRVELYIKGKFGFYSEFWLGCSTC